MAFRMQTEVPGVLSLENESRETRQLYGVDDPATSTLAADVFWHASWWKRAFALWVYAGNWDSRDYIHQAHGHLIQSVDRPIAGLCATSSAEACWMKRWWFLPVNLVAHPTMG